MLITSIRHKINSELDTRRSVSFMRYAMHFLQMFAFMGLIIPVLIGVDYFLDPQTKDETVVNKFYQVRDNLNQIEYFFFTDSYRFLSDIDFYENTKVDEQITFHVTPIFKAVTFVTSTTAQSVYTCRPHNIYGWPLIVVGITFICSIVMVIKTWGWVKKREYVRYDSIVNFGVVTSFLCLFTILVSLFHIP